MMRDSSPVELPVVLNDRGYAFSTAPHGTGEMTKLYVHSALHITASAQPEQRGLILIVWGGQSNDPEVAEQAVAACVTREALHALIVGLLAIDARLGEDS